ncbi:MAG: ATP-binding cassette domain-containing protein [Thermotogae bacterium]|nr:ATP-binding cassette domain-containing protein [Thermotogota bacterium]
MAMIEVRDLRKVYKDIVALDGVTFEVEKGEIFGLLGPNGAGKSTTIRILTTLTLPTSGSARVAGYDVVKHPMEVRRKIGLVAEKVILYDRLTAWENLMFFARLHDVPDKEARSRIEEGLKMVDMWEWRNVRVQKFSTGMKQRVNIVRSIIHRPEVLFLDEPTLGLDPQTTRRIREFVKELNERGTTIVLTTHLMNEAELLCDRVGIIDKGCIVALDTTAKLKRMIKSSGVEIVALEIPNGSWQALEELKRMPHISKVVMVDQDEVHVHMDGIEDAVTYLVNAVQKLGLKIRTIKSLEPTLEDVFIELTGHSIRNGVK